MNRIQFENRSRVARDVTMETVLVQAFPLRIKKRYEQSRMPYSFIPIEGLAPSLTNPPVMASALASTQLVRWLDHC